MTAFPAAGSRREGDSFALWAGAFGAAAATHLALGVFLLARPPDPPAAGEPLPAVLIDMAPPPAAPAEPADATPSPAVPVASAPEPALEPVPDVPDPAIPPPEPAAAAAEEDEAVPDPAPASEAAALSLPALPDAPAVVIPPPPRPQAAPAETRPRPAVRRRPEREPVAERRPPRPAPATRRAERRETREPPSAPSGARTTASLPSRTDGQAAANAAAWRRELVAHLQRSLRYPAGTGGGAATVSFSVNRAGRVTSASLARSSGQPVLDAAALAVFRGPVPPPPPDYAGQLSFTIPVRFTQR